MVERYRAIDAETKHLVNPSTAWKNRRYQCLNCDNQIFLVNSGPQGYFRHGAKRLYICDTIESTTTRRKRGIYLLKTILDNGGVIKFKRNRCACGYKNRDKTIKWFPDMMINVLVNDPVDYGTSYDVAIMKKNNGLMNVIHVCDMSLGCGCEDADHKVDSFTVSMFELENLCNRVMNASNIQGLMNVINLNDMKTKCPKCRHKDANTPVIQFKSLTLKIEPPPPIPQIIVPDIKNI